VAICEPSLNIGMKDEEFKKKLSEVAVWQMSRIQGANTPATRYLRSDECIEPPMELELKYVKPTPCPYREGQEGCYFHIHHATYHRYTVLVQRCKTCKGLVTPKGNFIEHARAPNYAQQILAADREQDK
jgi:hypothetical protein